MGFTRDQFTWTYSPETARLMVFVLFGGVVVLGLILTKIFANEHTHDTQLEHYFGYNNLCLYFDFKPATYIVPTCWTVVILVAAIYLFGFWVRVKISEQTGEISDLSFRIITVMSMFELFAVAFLIQSFVNKVDDMVSHTYPFMVFMFGLVSMCWKNVWFFNKIGVFHEPWLRALSWLYAVSFTFFTILKLVVQINGLAKSPFYGATSHKGQLFGRVVDFFWVFLATVVLVGVTYFVELKRAEKILVTFTVTDDKKALKPSLASASL